jgi:hypothetical protein
MAQKRPLGVTVICILGWILAALSILGGIAALFLGGLLNILSSMPTITSAIVGFLGVITLILGIVLILAFYWLWQMKKMGWTLVTVLMIIELVLSLVSLSILGIVLSLVILLYLWMKKDLFR